LLESSDPTERLCALNAWANISRHPAGLAFFLQWEGRLQTILGHTASTNNEVCKGAMACWAALLEDRPPSTSRAAPAPGMAQAPELELWSVAERRLVPVVIKNLKTKPFPDVRFHVWNLLAILTQSRPAAHAIVPSAEVRDLLLDFESEQDSQARIAKHAFVLALEQQSDWLTSYMDEDTVRLLMEYAKQGPHWVPRSASALVGDQSGG